MGRMGSFVLGAAIAMALLVAPVSLLVLWRSDPLHLLENIAKFQTLVGAGAALFAAGLAATGVWFNVTAQNANARRQLDAQRTTTAEQIVAQRESIERQLRQAEARAQADRDDQRRTAALERFHVQQQLASGFMGEIGAVLGLLQRRKTLFTQIARQVRASNKIGKFHLHVGVDFAVIYRANAASIGLLPVPLPGQVVSFYGDLLSFIERGNALDEIEEGSAKAEDVAFIYDSLEEERAVLELRSEELYKALYAEQDKLFSWPPLTSKLTPGQIANLSEALEKQKVDALELQIMLSQNLSPEEMMRRVAEKRRS